MTGAELMRKPVAYERNGFPKFRAAAALAKARGDGTPATQTLQRHTCDSKYDLVALRKDYAQFEEPIKR